MNATKLAAGRAGDPKLAGYLLAYPDAQVS
jgi:hypothetical protein